MVLRGRNLRAPLPCSTIPEIRNWWLSVSTVSPTFRCFEEANRSSTMMSSGPSNGPPDRYRKPPLTASKELRSMPSMTSTTPAVESWVTTGATATTCGSFMILSATLTETGAPLTPISSDELGGCTMMSAPIPACRLRPSSSMPIDRPTISRMSVTSTATATTLIMVGNGRCTRLARIIRFMGSLLPSAVIYGKLETGIGREEFVDFAQPLGQRIGGEQRIVALTQVLVIHVEIQ